VLAGFGGNVYGVRVGLPMGRLVFLMVAVWGAYRDRSIRNICIAAIRRYTIGPIDFAQITIYAIMTLIRQVKK